MRFSIITPSFRSSTWLKLCIASVADQGVELEHIVQDSVSDDGTQDWLPTDKRVKAFIEKDQGMYDAINRGLRRATGDILAYLNCDEQYLPDTLARVREFFAAHPAVEVAFGNTVVVNPQGEYLCHRKASRPTRYHTMVSGTMGIMSCATFFRRCVVESRGLYFNTQLRDLGDTDWVLRLLAQKVPLGLLRQFTSVFTNTGKNMNLLPNALREKAEVYASAPAWARAAHPWIVLQFRLRRWLAGNYRQPPFTFAAYTQASPAQRVTVHVPHPSYKWVS
jgi:glycosyltransferase involved in cell wall biosynthesis